MINRGPTAARAQGSGNPYCGVERIVQPSDQLGRLDARRVLMAKHPALEAENQAERLYTGGQVREPEGKDVLPVQIVKPERQEIAHHDATRIAARAACRIVSRAVLVPCRDRVRRSSARRSTRPASTGRSKPGGCPAWGHAPPRVRRIGGGHPTLRRDHCRSSASPPSRMPRSPTPWR